MPSPSSGTDALTARDPSPPDPRSSGPAALCRTAATVSQIRITRWDRISQRKVRSSSMALSAHQGIAVERQDVRAGLSRGPGGHTLEPAHAWPARQSRRQRRQGQPTECPELAAVRQYPHAVGGFRTARWHLPADTRPGELLRNHRGRAVLHQPAVLSMLLRNTRSRPKIFSEKTWHSQGWSAKNVVHSDWSPARVAGHE